MRFRIGTDGPKPITVVLEPSGAEYLLQPGDHFEFEWEESDRGPTPMIEHGQDSVTVSEGGGRSRMWNSNGDEMSMIG